MDNRDRCNYLPKAMSAIIYAVGLAALLTGDTRLSCAAEWFETLRPGITRAEILGLAGAPSLSQGWVDTYNRAQGRIQCVYEGDILQSAVYYNPPGGAISWTVYDTDGELKESDLQLRRVYLKKGRFALLPSFSGRRLYTNKYHGACYEVDGGFIVIEPVIDLGGGAGFFADKVARVLWLKSDGTETILYRASDHWKDLKPPGLLMTDVRSREVKLREAGDHLFMLTLTNILGEGDSFMGSGVDYRLFYLEDGLAVVVPKYRDGTIQSIRILKPGLTNLTFDEWIHEAPTNAVLRAH